LLRKGEFRVPRFLFSFFIMRWLTVFFHAA
jgi:hypothetical protein